LASTESIKHLEADEPLAKSRANSGAYAPEKEPWFPSAFLGVKGGGGLLPLAVLFNLPAIIAVTWYEW